MAKITRFASASRWSARATKSRMSIVDRAARISRRGGVLHALTNKGRLQPLLAVLSPTCPANQPILFNKVTIKGAKQAVQMFGPAQ